MQVVFPALFLGAGYLAGYMRGKISATKKPPEHEHVWGNWEQYITKLSYPGKGEDAWDTLIQKRECLGCGYRQNQRVTVRDP